MIWLGIAWILAAILLAASLGRLFAHLRPKPPKLDESKLDEMELK